MSPFWMLPSVLAPVPLYEALVLPANADPAGYLEEEQDARESEQDEADNGTSRYDGALVVMLRNGPGDDGRRCIGSDNGARDETDGGRCHGWGGATGEIEGAMRLEPAPP